jgi:hypothetical protein
MRPTKPCPLCGRGIYTDHNYSGLNFDRHVTACPEQQAKRYIASVKKANRKMRLADAAIPLVGQIGFPFDGVPMVVGRPVLTIAKRVIH